MNGFRNELIEQGLLQKPFSELDRQGSEGSTAGRSTAGQYVKDSFGEASLLKDAARRAAGVTLQLSDPIGVVLATRVSFSAPNVIGFF